MAQGPVGFVRVQAGVLQGVGVELGVQADAAAFLAKVEEEAAGGRDLFHGFAELGAAVAALAAEDIAGEALAVQPDQGRVAAVGRCAVGSIIQQAVPVAEGQQEVSLPSASPWKVRTSATVLYPSGKRSGTVTRLRTVAGAVSDAVMDSKNVVIRGSLHSKQEGRLLEA